MAQRAHIIFLLLLLLAVSSKTSDAADVATKLEISGLVTLSADVVRARFKDLTSTADAASLDEALKSLMSTGFFADIKIDRHGRTLRVTVVENDIVASVATQGSSAIDKSKIEPEIKLKAQDRYTTTRAHADAIRIRDLYRRQGRLATTVEPRTLKQPDGRVAVTFEIKEGAVNKIDRIAFIGAQAFSEKQLRDVVSTSESSWFDILKSAAFYDPERIESDRELIRKHYADHGHPDASVTDVAAALSADGTNYTITFTIDEGDKQTFGTTKIDSKIGGYDGTALASVMAIKSDTAYSRDSVERTVAKR